MSYDPSNQKIGLELEYHNLSNRDMRAYGYLSVERSRFTVEGVCWETKLDGSLRKGLELVTAPTTFNQVQPSLVKVLDAVNRTQALDDGKSGLHMHLDALSLGKTAIWGVANVFFRFNVEFPRFFKVRGVRSHFCPFDHVLMAHAINVTPSTFWNNIHEGFRRSIVDVTAMNTIVHNFDRYSALNLCALYRHRTVEVRCLNSTKDAKTMFDQITWMLSLFGLLREKRANKFTDFSSLVSAVNEYRDRVPSFSKVKGEYGIRSHAIRAPRSSQTTQM